MCIRAIIVLSVQVPKFIPDKCNYVVWHSIAAQRYHAMCSLMAFKTDCAKVGGRCFMVTCQQHNCELKNCERKVNSSNLEPGHKDPTPQEKQPRQELWVHAAAFLAQAKHSYCTQEAKRGLSSCKQL